jgi:hypothetical protein
MSENISVALGPFPHIPMSLTSEFMLLFGLEQNEMLSTSQPQAKK